MKFNLNFKANSLTNAIYLSLIISIFCGCLVLISYYINSLIDKMELGSELIKRNESAFLYFLNNHDELLDGKTVEKDLFGDGIISQSEVKKWGFYQVLICKTIFKKDTITKSALIGQKEIADERLALYLTNYDRTLRVSGKSKLIGKLLLPNSKIEYFTINNKIKNNVIVSGEKLESEKRLPQLNDMGEVNIEGLKKINPNLLKEGDVFVNSFDKETLLLDLNGLSELPKVSLKGNIILTSNSPVTLTNGMELNDVLVLAPKVLIKEGFKGNLQIVAQHEVELEENVSLSYPSSLYLKNQEDSIQVRIGKNSYLSGGLVVDGNTYLGSLKRKVWVDENAKIVGDLFCNGSLSLQGRVFGSVYTNRFFLETSSSKYENVILNGTINRDSLNEAFVRLPLFPQEEKSITYSIIKNF